MEFARGATMRDHAFGWSQLVHAADGVARVETDDATWVLPPGLALWVPGGVRHTLRCSTRLSLRTLYFPGPAGPERCRVVAVSPLLRAAIVRLVELQAAGADRARVEHLAAVVVDELAVAEVEPLSLPLPSTPAARRVADRILAESAARASLDELCGGAGASRRTVERLFAVEVGAPLGHWRRIARLHAAVVALASGAPVAAAAEVAGFSSPSAFVVAFKRAFGRTPGAYVTG
ncbi:MAG: helix-turn-helix transcriptional regulator [Myxococcota bacterium]